MPFQGVSRSVLVGGPLDQLQPVRHGVVSTARSRRAAAERALGEAPDLATIAATVQVPDLIEPVVAFRAWRIENGTVMCPVTGEWWPPGMEFQARCLREAHLEPAPVHDCTCGIYAFHEPWTVATWYASRPGDAVPGVMLAWGRIEASFGGLRSQFARLVCLGLPAFADRDRKRTIYAEAERQGIQVAPLRHLAKIASAAGDAIPSSLRGDP